jgi:hypothetical protein
VLVAEPYSLLRRGDHIKVRQIIRHEGFPESGAFQTIEDHMIVLDKSDIGDHVIYRCISIHRHDIRLVRPAEVMLLQEVAEVKKEGNVWTTACPRCGYVHKCEDAGAKTV